MYAFWIVFKYVRLLMVEYIYALTSTVPALTRLGFHHDGYCVALLCLMTRCLYDQIALFVCSRLELV